MLARRSQDDAREAAGYRKDDFVDLERVEQRQNDLEAVALVLRTMRRGTDRDADSPGVRFAHQTRDRVDVFLLLILRVVSIQEPRVDFDGHSARVCGFEHLVFVVFEMLGRGPVSERRGQVEVADHVARQLFYVVQQLGDVELPGFFGSDVLEEVRELGVVDLPRPIRAFFRVIDRNEVHRADNAVRAHRFDDVLRVRPRARVVVHLGADRKTHAATQGIGDDGSVCDVDACGFGGAVEIAGVREFKSATDRVNRAGIFERQIVDVIAHHHETRRTAPACMIEPQEQHPRGIRNRPLLRKRPVLALGVAVNVGDDGNASVAQRSTSFTPRGIHNSRDTLSDGGTAAGSVLR